MLHLLPEFQNWVRKQLMTAEEALQLQTLFEQMQTGETLDCPEHLHQAVQNLGLDQMVDELTATMH